MSPDSPRKPVPESSLLRLFESDFFNSRLALLYLFRYPKQVGIHHYICRELRKYPEEEIEFLLPQLCHLMVSRPQDSASLEEFLIWVCQKSQHLAIIAMWYLEAYLHDMDGTLYVQTESFALCERLYHKCQTIIFAETTLDLSQPDLLSAAISGGKPSTFAHVPPIFVGIGVMLASIGSPIAHQATEKLLKVESLKPRYNMLLDTLDSDEELPSEFSISEAPRKSGAKVSFLSRILARIPTTSPSLEELSGGAAFSFSHFRRKTAQVARSIRRLSLTSTTGGSDPGRRRSENERSSISPSLDIKRVGSVDDVSEVIEDHQLINPHYFHSEIQFIMALVDISERLVSTPKPSRQSSLIAELTLINHNLPANICLPFWCPAQFNDQKHHQIVRIALSDCVVLNSAERVPFLICIEVIESGDAQHRKSQSGASEPGKELPPRNVDGTNSRRSSEYFKSVLSRRESAIENRKSARIDPETSQGSNSSSNHPKLNEKNPATQEFADKMRTAAVMLAQLYQQQQKEVAKIANKKSGRFRSFSSATSTVRAASLELSRHDRGASTGVLTASNEKNVKKLQMDFEEIRGRVLKEMSISEAARLVALARRQPGIENVLESEALPPEEEEDLHHGTFHQEGEDPSATVFFEPWQQKKNRIRESSPYGSNPKWELYAVIVKSGADLRQEQLALQLIKEIQRSWKSFDIPIWVYSFRMMITSGDAGLVEVIPDSVSIHSIKKAGYMERLNQPGIVYTLYDHFLHTFGPAGSPKFLAAQENFIRSLAGYSIISYLLQIKDRHNGNILMDIEGHLAHIDFGFMLMNSPGSVGFELAPFKLPQEYIDIIGGLDSERFEYFRSLFKTGFLALRKRVDNITNIVEIMEKDSRLPCFTGANKQKNNFSQNKENNPVTAALRARFHLQLADDAFCDLVDELIDSSYNNMFTKLYDNFQYYANGIL